MPLIPITRLFFISICIALVGCMPDPVSPTPSGITFETENLLTNAGFELGVGANNLKGYTSDSIPQAWDALIGPTYAASWDDRVRLAGNRSVRLSSNWVDPAALAYISQSLPIPTGGKRYRLQVNMRLDSVAGRGMSLNIQGFNGEVNCCPDYEFASESNTDILGSSGWTLYTLTTPGPIPENITTLLIRIDMQRSTTGRANVDEVALFREE